jgi:hypothetical protein
MESHKPENPAHTAERRSEPRFEVGLPIEYRRAGASRFRHGHTLNFSEDGFMLLLSERMEEGEEIEVKIYFTSPSGLAAVAAIAEVVWSEADAEEDGYYRSGVRYLDIPAAGKETLEEFLGMYADPNRASAEIKPRASPSRPGKLPTPERPGPTAEAPPAPAFLKRLISLGWRAMAKAAGF